ncbi:hypothetical protein ACJRO7_000449 [Eucalyptus globulus]|uniref:Polygalacturonase n=1 Tax=Eucalyptus globulus TaxID=34317 RepID=A0ABD3LQY7_EUCGL
MLGALLLLLAQSNAVNTREGDSEGQCEYKLAMDLDPRPNGKTLNPVAFQNAIFYLKSFADKGGAQLYVPPGSWLTGSFNLTSHLTLFLEREATVLVSQDPSHWDIVEPLPSNGCGIQTPGRRYRSLINGYGSHDVVVTSDNGTIDGQGAFWWDLFTTHSLNYSHPHLMEFVEAKHVVVSNITFLNAPAYNIHPVYCSDVHIQNVSITASPESPHTVGIVPGYVWFYHGKFLDSSDNICIEDCSISMGYDSIALRSGWDEYGISYNKPTSHVHIRRAYLQLHSSSSGYIEDMTVSGVDRDDIHMAFGAKGHFGSHLDENFNPNALPALRYTTLQNVVGRSITIAGNFTGISESPFTSICLSNISLFLNPGSLISWICSDVSGSYSSVLPEPCPELAGSSSNSSSACISSGTAIGNSTAL